MDPNLVKFELFLLLTIQNINNNTTTKTITITNTMTPTSTNESSMLKPQLIMQQSIGNSFESSDYAIVDEFKSADLALLFSSTDSSSDNNGAGGIPKPRLMTTRSVSKTLLAKVLASRDSSGFTSLDLKSLDPLPAVEAASNAALSKGDESSEWVSYYQGTHRDIAINPEDAFRTGEMPPLVLPSAASNSWMGMYEEAMGSSATTFAPQSAVFVAPAPKKSTGSNNNSKPTTDIKRGSNIKRSRVPKGKVYIKPTDRDILCGRGGRSNRWKGNERYRQIIEEHKPAYHATSAKHEKTLLSQQLVQDLQAEGRRFLKLDNTTNQWFVVPDVEARRKAGQALREENTAASRLAKRQKYCH